jgi:ATP-dependent DNA helicase RecQ
LRSRLADEHDVPAYLVFSDEVLWAMIDRRPTTTDEMLDIPGVGPAKLARFGSAFLETLASE